MDSYLKRKHLTIFLCVAIFFPSLVFAHAVPTAYEPTHGALLASPPTALTVTFSERVDPHTAALILHTATGSPRTLLVLPDAMDPHTIHALLPPLFGGVTIMWGVTSLDDGHYTRGAFNFGVEGAGGHLPVPQERMMNEAELTILLFVLTIMLIVLLIVSWVFLEKKPRCPPCLRSYTLLLALMGSGVLVVSLLLLFVSPIPEWKIGTKEGGMSIQLHALLGSPLMYLTVESAEELPMPLFEISNHDASIDPMPIALTLLLRGDKSTTYSFPTGVFVPYGNWHISTTFVRGNHYDAHGAMTFVYPDDILSAMGKSPMHSPRAWEVITLSSFALFLMLWRCAKVLAGKSPEVETRTPVRPFIAYGTAVLAFTLLLATAALFTYGIAMI